MVNRKSYFANAYETALTAQLPSTGGTATVASVTGLTVPCYLVLDPDSPSKREYVYVDGIVGLNLNLAERYLSGSAAGSGIVHDSGAVVRLSPTKQGFEDLHDRIDAGSIHAGLTGLGADDHSQYLNIARHDVTTRHQPGSSIPVAAPGSSAPSDTPAEGSALTVARADHRHGREAHGSAQHAAGTVVPTGIPGASAPGDTASEGSAATAARSDHRHAREGYPTVSGARLYLSALQTIPNNALTQIDWTAESFDTEGYHNPGSGSIIIPGSGKYLVNIVLQWSIEATWHYYTLQKNAVAVAQATSGLAMPNGSANESMPLTTILALTGGDVLSVQAYQNSGGSRDIGPGEFATRFEIVRLGS